MRCCDERRKTGSGARKRECFPRPRAQERGCRASLTPVLFVHTKSSVCTGFWPEKSSTKPRLHQFDHLDSSSFGFAPVLSFQMLQAPEGMIVGNQHRLDSQRVGGKI